MDMSLLQTKMKPATPLPELQTVEALFHHPEREKPVAALVISLLCKYGFIYINNNTSRRACQGGTQGRII